MEHDPKFAVVLPLTDFAAARTAAEAADELGFHAVATEDHFFMAGLGRDRNEPRLECFTLLSALAPLTRRVRLTQVVAGNSYRHPALLAKIVTSLDVISGGRADLGLGAGWFREEYEAFGIPYPKPSIRIAQMREALQIVKALWTEDAVTYAGTHYTLRDAPHVPKPKQRPRIMIGGGGEKLLRVAAAEADIVNIIPPSSGAKGKVMLDEALAFGMDEFRQKVDTLAQACREVGRDFGDIELSGMVFVLIGRTEEEADSYARMTAQMMGLDDVESARSSPSTLVGTPEQLAAEILRRRSDLGVSYYFCNFLTPDGLELFGREVIPRLK
jgi:probable F420-dependent oxidoreductase